jgi:hypothetical protein
MRRRFACRKMTARRPGRKRGAAASGVELRRRGSQFPSSTKTPSLRAITKASAVACLPGGSGGRGASVGTGAATGVAGTVGATESARVGAGRTGLARSAHPELKAAPNASVRASHPPATILAAKASRLTAARQSISRAGVPSWSEPCVRDGETQGVNEATPRRRSTSCPIVGT